MLVLFVVRCIWHCHMLLEVHKRYECCGNTAAGNAWALQAMDSVSHDHYCLSGVAQAWFTPEKKRDAERSCCRQIIIML